MDVNFKINNEIITLSEPIDGSNHLFKLTNDPEYAVEYLNQLVNNGFISLKEPIQFIYRIEDDNSEILIYPPNEDTFEVERECQPVKNGTQDETREIIYWSDEQTRNLLDLYEEYAPRVGPQKKFKTKKNMWGKIAEEINVNFSCNKTGIQCENRYKTVLKKKKTAIENNSTSGSSREPIPFEKELEKIASLDDSIQPEVLGTAKKITILKNIAAQQKNRDDMPESKKKKVDEEDYGTSTPSSLTSPTSKKTKHKLSVQETLLEIFERREEAKERRHREKLELLKTIFSQKAQTENK